MWEGSPINVVMVQKALAFQLFLGETRKEPAEIGEAIQVTQDLRVGMLAYIKRRDPALGPAANRARHIERGSKRSASGHRPTFAVERFILLQIIDRGRQPIDHCGRR